MIAEERRQAVDSLFSAWDSGREQDAESALRQIVKMLWGSDKQPDLTVIREAIGGTGDIVSLNDGWDGPGSLGITNDTWSRASEFVLGLATSVWHASGLRLQTPEFLPTPDGSIDIEWQIEAKEFVVRVPSNASEKMAFYGSRPDQFSVRGTFDEDARDVAWLLVWIAHE